MGIFSKFSKKEKVDQNIITYTNNDKVVNYKPICQVIMTSNIGEKREMTSNIVILMTIVNDELLNKDFIKFVQLSSHYLHFSKLLEDSKTHNTHYIMNGSLHQFKKIVRNTINQDDVFLKELKEALYNFSETLFQDEIQYGLMKRGSFNNTVIQASNTYFVDNYESLQKILSQLSLYEDVEVSDNLISKYELFEMCAITFEDNGRQNIIYFKNFMKYIQSEQEDKLPEIIRNIEIPFCYMGMSADKQMLLYNNNLEDEVDEVEYDDKEK